ncbi:uncharacterized protein L201_000874 [Kwoniella dendrophila CBS 6074]|uniref:Uncharacterized protein n=1 Tax=Kwoniella dendrophila CBS 6074 TaxID=1295534 RepID=A0AAX4JMC4_9TREE
MPHFIPKAAVQHGYPLANLIKSKLPIEDDEDGKPTANQIKNAKKRAKAKAAKAKSGENLGEKDVINGH